MTERDAGLGGSPDEQPLVVGSTTEVVAAAAPDAVGAVWRLPVAGRDLDSNVVALPPGGVIHAHDGPEVDVLVHVLAGSGRLDGERRSLELQPGVLLWLPRRSRRAFSAGSGGLRYLTVHRRRQSLVIGSRGDRRDEVDGSGGGSDRPQGGR